MIIFFKNDGTIIGNIAGRVHGKEHLNMWIGDKKETKRLVVQWKPTGEKTTEKIENVVFAEAGEDENGEPLFQSIVIEDEFEIIEFEPEHEQKELFKRLEKNPVEVNNYKVDVKTNKLVKK